MRVRILGRERWRYGSHLRYSGNKSQKTFRDNSNNLFLVCLYSYFFAHDMSSERDTFGLFIIISCFGGTVFDYKTLLFYESHKNKFASNAFLLRLPVYRFLTVRPYSWLNFAENGSGAKSGE